MDEEKFADTVASLCYTLYTSLPKTGKPRSDGCEWTLCACFVQKHEDGFLKVVSLATGSKCIGRSKLNSSGMILHDSHAEVLARRGFLRYLYEQIESFQKTGVSEVFKKSSCWDGKYCLKEHIEFCLFSSHVPCGDASIISKDTDGENESVYEDNIGQVFNVDAMNPCKRKIDDKTPWESDQSKKLKTMDQSSEKNECVGSALQVEKNSNQSNKDIFRTGAKCVPSNSRQDSHSPGVGYHVVGAVRTKPGRGDPTLSVSCSDKLARWNSVGVQGALLTHLIELPIFIKTIVIGGGGPFSIDSIHRAIVSRFNSTDLNVPLILRSSLVFMHARYNKSASSQPAPASVIWCASSKKQLEVAVDGKKQGATKKSKNSALLVCRKSLFEMFISLTGEKFKSQTYYDCKQSAEAYQRIWKIRKKELGAWSDKPPELQQFQLQPT